MWEIIHIHANHLALIERVRESRRFHLTGLHRAPIISCSLRALAVHTAQSYCSLYNLKTDVRLLEPLITKILRRC